MVGQTAVERFGQAASCRDWSLSALLTAHRPGIGRCEPWSRLAKAIPALALGLLVGCAATPVEKPRAASPPPPVPPEVWRQVDRDIYRTSAAAEAGTEGYALSALEDWMGRVGRRTEEVFIPWYTSFGTQQWLSFKAGWYGMGSAEGGDEAAERLAAYLQEQYYERVLEPLAGKADPRQIMEAAAREYVLALRAGILKLPDRYGLDVDAFRAHLDRIPAIGLYGEPAVSASLGRLVGAERPAELPAYVALLARIRPDDEALAAGLADNRFYALARSSADRLAEQMGIRSGATAAGLALGGVGGILVSVGVSAWQAMEHEKDKAALEAELRANLRTALDGMWRYLSGDPQGGVLAPVRHMSARIENGLLSLELQPAPARPDLTSSRSS
jgi:hypothetical protein